METTPRCNPLGNAALLLTYADTISRDVAQRIAHDAEQIAAATLPSVTDIVPGYVTLALYFDPQEISYEALRDRAMTLLHDAPPRSHQDHREIVIPVQYNGADLEEVATQTGLSIADVISRHSQVRYYTYMLGFVPGFAYLGDLDPALVLPRLATPRPNVPPGSVAIAGAQTAVYPLATPGGWHIIGHTDLVMFDPQRSNPALLRPGDYVYFEAVRS